MPSENNTLFPNNYKDILEIHPSCKEYSPTKEEPYLCDGFLCLACSPIVAIVRSICCFGVSCKKINKSCKNKETMTTISKQPQSEPQSEPQLENKHVAPKEILLNPSLK